MFHSFSAGWLSNIYEEALDAEDLTACYNSDHIDVDSFRPVLHFPLDPVTLTWLENNSSTPAAAPFAPTPAQISPAPADNVTSIEAPSTMASSRCTSSIVRYEITSSITVRELRRRLAGLYDGSRLIVAHDEQGRVVWLLPAPQVSILFCTMTLRKCLDQQQNTVHSLQASHSSASVRLLHKQTGI
jgi:hypothetical protein